MGSRPAQGTKGASSMATIDKLSMLHFAVSDVQRSKAFYTEKLGFKVTSDSQDFSQGNSRDRWVSLMPPGGGVSFNITNVFENMQPGTLKLYLSTPDVRAAHEELRARGVKPNHNVTEDSWGTWFDFNDPDGHHWFLVQSKY
jgi:catechol 2,3-dioxygenase-like lactoylglutathione lyase family enzyme